jgi:hypothetical protein
MSKKPQFFKIKKTNEELQVVVSEVYAPNMLDSQGDFMTAEEICAMAYDFMINGKTDMVDVNHDNKLYGCYVVESFIAREDDSIFIPGSWVVGIYVPDPNLWNAIKNGDLDGFSMEAECFRKKDVEFEMDSTLALKGHCESCPDGRTHQFAIKVSKSGEFLGGVTSADPVDGHFHTITHGEYTDETNGHTHKYSHAEEVFKLDAQSERK